MAIAFKWLNFSNSITGDPTTGPKTIGVANANTAAGSVAAGDLLIAGISLYAPPPTDTVTKPAGWTQFGGPLSDSGNGSQSQFYYHVAAAPETVGSPAYDFNNSASRYWGWTLMCYSGVDGTTPIDDFRVQMDTSGGGSLIIPFGGGSFTTTAANDLFVMLLETFMPTTATVFTFPTGSTTRQPITMQVAGTFANAAGDLVITTVGSAGPYGISAEAFKNYAYVAVMLKAASGGPVAPPPRVIGGLLGD
jgi:hypothetical protein